MFSIYQGCLPRLLYCATWAYDRFMTRGVWYAKFWPIQYSIDIDILQNCQYIYWLIDMSYWYIKHTNYYRYNILSKWIFRKIANILAYQYVLLIYRTPLGCFICQILMDAIFCWYQYFAKLSIYWLIVMSYWYIKHS